MFFLVIYTAILLGVLSERNANATSSTENVNPIPREGHNSVHQAKQDIRIRHEFTAMSLVERRRFVKAYKTVSTVQPYRKQYDYLVDLHASIFKEVHVDIQFFPWHRWYLLEFENLLRRVDKRITLPYWDWSINSQKWRNTGIRDVWSHHPWGLGGNGSAPFGCVEDGPFGKTRWRLTNASGTGCLRRRFMNARMPGVIAVHLILRMTPKKFAEFEKIIRLFFHNEPHCCVGGTMDLDNASNAPEFIIHHCFIDKIWHEWQLKNPDHKFTFNGNMTSKLLGTPYKVSQFMDASNLVGGTEVHYRDPFIGYKQFQRTLSSLSNRLLLITDSYNWRSNQTCCYLLEGDVAAHKKDFAQIFHNIPIEVALDYGTKNKNVTNN